MLEKIKAKLESFATAKHSNPCIITYQGKQIKVPSGKTAWRNKGDAKKALTNALQSYAYYQERKAFQEEIGFESLSTYLEEQGIIKFSTFDQDLKTQNEKLEVENSFLYTKLQLLTAMEEALDELQLTEKVYEIIHRDYPMG